MTFAYDTELALQSAVWLVNSAKGPDRLESTESLRDFLQEWSYSGSHDRSQAELAEVRRARATLRQMLIAPRDQAAAIVNEILDGANAVPQLVRHDEFDWHLHAVSSDDSLARRILVETAMAMIDVIRVDQHSRISVCGADDCNGLVLDLSRNRSRKFCSTTCGNRVAVAAYRARQATEGP